MINPRLRHLPHGNDATKPSAYGRHPTPRSPAEFADSEARFVDQLRERFGADWIVEFPLINPVSIIIEAPISPIGAAVMCQRACHLLGRGYHRRLNEYVSAAYTVARSFRGHEKHIELLASDIIDGRTKSGLNVETVSAEILHYLCIYIFFQSGMTTRNRATQYAQALQPFFDANVDPSIVDQSLRKHGIERLYRAAGKLKGIVRGAQAWAGAGKDPSTATIEEVLASLAADEAPKATMTEEITDFGWRELPPADPDQNNVDSEVWSDLADDLETGGVQQARSSSEGDATEGTKIPRVRRPALERQLKALIPTAIELTSGLADLGMDLQKQKKLESLAAALATDVAKLELLLTPAPTVDHDYLG